MTDQRNTGRRPNIHWYRKDLDANGFTEAFENAHADSLVGLYLPEVFLRAWIDMMDRKITPEQFEKVRAEWAPELSVRADDVKRTILGAGTFNESHVCPPDCS